MPSMRLVSDAFQSSLSLSDPSPAANGAGPAARLLQAATTLLWTLECGQPLDAHTLREAMTEAFGASDSEGAWLARDNQDETPATIRMRRAPGVG
jgi:hypothetical protein